MASVEEIFEAAKQTLLEKVVQFTLEKDLETWAKANGVINDVIVQEQIDVIKGLKFRCLLCKQIFKYKRSLTRHSKSVHEKKESWNCCICGKICYRRDLLTTHEKKCKEKKKQKKYLKKKTRNDNPKSLKADQPHSTKEIPSKEQKRIKCRKCGAFFSNRKDLCHHQLSLHVQRGGNESYPWGNASPPWVENGVENKDFERIYKLNFPLIRNSEKIGDLHSSYNFALPNEFTPEAILEKANEVYNKQTKSFRLNLIFGVVLKHLETSEYRYFKPFENEEIFNFPLYVTKRSDLQKLLLRLRKLDIYTYLLRQRPNTKWRPIFVSNVRFEVYSSNFTLGTLNEPLPKFISGRNNAIISFEKDPHSSKLYGDNLCMFRCLAYHKLGSMRVNGFEASVKQLYKCWQNYLYEHQIANIMMVSFKDFKGVDISEIQNVEECFSINIDVFELNEGDEAQVRYKSLCSYDDHIYLNIFQNHLSFIKDIKRYCNKYVCDLCQKHFATEKKLKRHNKGCGQKTKHIFPGGFYKNSKSIFDELREFDVQISPNEEFYPWFITFDMEALLRKDTFLNNTKNVDYERVHIPVSVSICSNVEDFTSEQFFCCADLDELLSHMLEYMHKISEKTFELSRVKWRQIFEKLNDLKQFWKPSAENLDCDEIESSDSSKAQETDEFEPPSRSFISKMKRPNVFKQFMSNLENDKWNVEYNDFSSSSEFDSDEENEQSFQKDDIPPNNVTDRVKKIMYNHLTRLENKFISYCRQCPVLGFNSGKYDLNLIKSKLAKHLGMHKSKSTFVIKKNNVYTCLNTPTLRFLDMTQYLAPGTSYSKFLLAYGVKEKKGFFPYEWFDQFEKLDFPGLPPLGDAWYSSLKQKSVLGDDNSSIEENYDFLRDVWNQNNMKTFKDFLRWYNNNDVKPMVEATQNFLKYYWEKKIDVFKITFSIPGIARRNLLDSASKVGAVFPLFDNSNKDIFHKIEDNICGGPSIIFCRYHKAAETLVRGQKLCSRIVGYDANSLYVYCLNQAFPVGYMVVRHKDKKFMPEKRDKYWNMYIWMNYLNLKHGYQIMHKLNNNREKRCGPYPVDGFDANQNTIFQYNGCYIHGHTCYLTKNLSSDEKLKRYKKTMDCISYLTSLGYKLEIMWECEFLKMKSTNRELKEFADSNSPKFYRKHKSKVSEHQILKAIRKDELFGMVECDIDIPKTWSKDNPVQTTLSPYEYFKGDVTNICTTEVPFSEIGTHMREYAVNSGISQNPRTLLIGGYRAKQVLVSTPLLSWYMNHGMVISNVTTVIESASMACFKTFVDDITQGRRQGDIDKTKSVISNTKKVEGNSAYGGLLLNKQKFTSLDYVEGRLMASKKINEPLFKKLCELDDDFYEIEMSKRKIVYDIPIQLAFFVLNYAKLRLLQFYYDFLDKYIDRSNFELIETDTDSIYFAITSNHLEKIIKDDHKEKYKCFLKNKCMDIEFPLDLKDFWFPRTCCDKHSLFDLRTPGLFKLEFDGNEMIGLCSKTYVISNTKIVKKANCSKTRILARKVLSKYFAHKNLRLPYKNNKTYRIEKEVKFSSKGISKTSLKNHVKLYKTVLKTKKVDHGINRGFILKNNKIYSYKQIRNGISYFYMKRKVLDDGIHTEPLDMTLTPCKRRKVE